MSAQVVLWSTDTIQHVECEWTPFKRGKIVLADSIVQTRFVRYVIADEFAGGQDGRIISNLDSSLVADALDPITCINMEPKSVRPVWVSINVPYDAEPGEYEASMLVYSYQNPTQELRFKLNVLQRAMPHCDEWTFYLDIRQNPLSIANYYKNATPAARASSSRPTKSYNFV